MCVPPCVPPFCRGRQIATARAGPEPTRVAFRPRRAKGPTRADEGTRARPRDRSERGSARKPSRRFPGFRGATGKKGRARPYFAACSVTVTRCYRRRLQFRHGRVCASVHALTAQRLRPYRLIRIGSRQRPTINTDVSRNGYRCSEFSCVIQRLKKSLKTGQYS
jgi:hypothetical protein